VKKGRSWVVWEGSSTVTIVSARGRRRLTHLAVWALVLVCPGLAAAQSTLERARAQYNEGLLDEAIATATVASSRPSLAPSATLIVASASNGSSGWRSPDLQRREARFAEPRALAPQKPSVASRRVVLFLDDQLDGARVFTSVLPCARAVRRPSSKLLEWWAAPCELARPSQTIRTGFERFQADVGSSSGELSRPAMCGWSRLTRTGVWMPHRAPPRG
jgi:hypothetical protein